MLFHLGRDGGLPKFETFNIAIDLDLNEKIDFHSFQIDRDLLVVILNFKPNHFFVKSHLLFVSDFNHCRFLIRKDTRYTHLCTHSSFTSHRGLVERHFVPKKHLLVMVSIKSFSLKFAAQYIDLNPDSVPEPNLLDV